MVDVALVLLRLVVGLTLAGHGSQKLFGWFGGGGIAGTRNMMRRIDVHPSIFWAWVSGLNEFVGGLLTALGLFMPLGPLMIVANMLVAAYRVHLHRGFWNEKGGYEYPIVLMGAAIAIGLIGAGAYSLDALLGIHAPEPVTLILGLAVVIVGFAISLLTGRLQAHVRGEDGLSQGSRS